MEIIAAAWHHNVEQLPGFAYDFLFGAAKGRNREKSLDNHLVAQFILNQLRIAEFKPHLCSGREILQNVQVACPVILTENIAAYAKSCVLLDHGFKGWQPQIKKIFFAHEGWHMQWNKDRAFCVWNRRTSPFKQYRQQGFAGFLKLAAVAAYVHTHRLD